MCGVCVGVCLRGEDMRDIETRVALLEQAVNDLKHRARNDRQIQIALNEELIEVTRELGNLRASLYAGIGVACVLGPGLVWLMDRI